MHTYRILAKSVSWQVVNLKVLCWIQQKTNIISFDFSNVILHIWLSMVLWREDELSSTSNASLMVWKSAEIGQFCGYKLLLFLRISCDWILIMPRYWWQFRVWRLDWFIFYYYFVNEFLNYCDIKLEQTIA